MGLTGIATTINDFMNAGPSTVWGLICILLVGIPVTLIHELGHAVVAGARLGSEVLVTVGNTGRVGSVRVGRLTTTFNAFQLPTRLGGVARFDARRATSQDMLWISLAGPAASLAAGLLAVVAYRHAPAGGVVHALLWAAVFDSVFAVANLIPLRLRERRGGPAFSTDGMIALSALALIITGRSRPSTPSHRVSTSGAAATSHVRPERANMAVRAWRHEDHVHVGVGTEHAFDTRAAAVATMSPDTARDMARALLELANEATTALPTQPNPPQPDQRITRAGGGSVAPPGYAD